MFPLSRYTMRIFYCLLALVLGGRSSVAAMAERIYLEPFVGVAHFSGDELYAVRHISKPVSATTGAGGVLVGLNISELLGLEVAYLKSGMASQSLALSPPYIGFTSAPVPTSGDFSFKSSEWRMGVAAKHAFSARWSSRIGAGISIRTVEIENSDYPVSSSVVQPFNGVIIPYNASVWRSFQHTTFYVRAGVIRSFSNRLSLTFDYSYSGPVTIEVPYTRTYYFFPSTNISAHSFLVGLLWKF